ncbi:FAD-binding domain-containing protein [Exidia glandulosa HHB12029]|uniref:FAD-binding domain-containing protein n=1 Tax=Exidia glandulosa HHB12029 TaxID=1314781 RepID=A0A165QVH5_EXIGL|nr:FAD-binding domain-containing protein [Exidia glandulosa HHB12029]
MILALALLAFAARSAAASANATCNSIATAFAGSSSGAAVYWPGAPEYTLAIEHWLLSSIEQPACVAEPANAKDVGHTLRLVGATRTPFAVKGGGHTSNKGFSSTTAVHISLAKFNYTRLDAASKTAAIGAGTRWSDVYAAMDGTGLNVVGGRNPAVGVAGFTLGGGYSWKSSQFGLAIDNVLSVKIVLPNGVPTVASATENPDLFFALKGGFNNFGIVTEFTFRAVPQDSVWAGRVSYDSAHTPAALAALAHFEQTNTDPRAAVVGGIGSTPSPTTGQLATPTAGLQLFYDGPSPPAGVFQEFLDIPSVSNTWGGPITFLQWTGTDGGVSKLRGVFHAFSTTKHTNDFLTDVTDNVAAVAAELGPKSAVFLSVAIEPFLPSTLLQANASSSAYPPVRSPVLLPSNIFFGYTDATQDDTFRDAIIGLRTRLVESAQEKGLILPASEGGSVYSNYALAGDDTALDFYGAEHLARMRRVREKVDPFNVMRLAGGWKI